MIARYIGMLLLGAVAMILVFALALQVLPGPSGLVGAEPAPNWPLHRMVPNSTYHWAQGWNLGNIERGHINNAGYVAPFDYHDGAPVGVVIGDSYIEGYMNPYPAMLQAKLADVLGLRQDQVYNFGSSGASLPHYLGVARFAGQRYRPQWAVVLIGTEDFIEGFGDKSGFFSWTNAGSPSGDIIRFVPDKQHYGLLSSVMRNLAIVSYIRNDLKFSPATLFASGFSTGRHRACQPATLSDGDRLLLSKWIADVPAALHLPPERVLLIFNADRQQYSVGMPTLLACPTRDSLALQWLEQQSAGAGLKVLDAAPLFAAAWARDHLPLDRAPVDAHWTPYTHALVAQAAAAKFHPAVKATAP